MNDKMDDGFWWKTNTCQVIRSSRDSKNYNGDDDIDSRYVQSDAGIDTYIIWTTYAK